VSALSILQGQIAVTCANPIYLISERDSEVIFEVLEDDATSLKARLGKLETYVLDGPPFLAELTTLEERQSTHLALEWLRHKKTLRAVLIIHKRQHQPN
jgi:hypothetical protein